VATDDDWIRMDDEGFIGLVGPVFHRPFGDGVGRFRFEAAAKHRNRSGVVHGGMLMTFADRALGVTARQCDPGRRQATVQLDVHFIRGARIGRIIEMECRVIRETRSLVFVDGTIFDAEGVIATARGVWKIQRPANVGD
jgi:uncharacterized protein (TIGR00369 family)